MNVPSLAPVLAMTIGLQLWTLRCAVAEHHLGKSQESKDIKIEERLEGVDLSGVGSLTLSPNGELAAGLKVLYGESGPGSLVNVWAIKEKRLVHQFRVPGKARAVSFTPDSSTLVTADETGNLGCESTIRLWDLAQGKERKLSACVGQVDDLVFSPDGRRLAAVAKLGPFEIMAGGAVASVVQIHVWQVAGEGDALRIDITHPCGESVELWPSTEKFDPCRDERIQAAFRRTIPMRLRFSSDGTQLICETHSGLRTIYDSRSGKMLKHTNLSSVGVFTSMLMIALRQVPANAKSLTVKITPRESPMQIDRTADGWWRTGTDGEFGLKVDGAYFVSLIAGVEKKEHMAMRLGLKDDTNLAELSSLRHPLGAIKIKRDVTGLTFRLEEVTDGTETGETLQAGEVRWALTENE